MSVYRAAKRSGRILYEDDYTALIASAAGGSIPRPDVFPDVYAFTPRPLRDKRKDMFFEFENKRGLRAIAHSGKFVMIVRSSMCGFMNKLYNSSLYLQGSTLVYSMWSGYKQEKRTAEFLDCVESLNLTDNMRIALECRMAGLSYPEIGRILERAQATVYEYFIKMRQRYTAIYG